MPPSTVITVTLQTKFASCCRTRVVTISLPFHNVSSGFEMRHHLSFFRQWSLTTTTNEIVTTSKRQKTAPHGMGYIKEMRVVVSNEIWTNSNFFFPPPNFQHAEKLPTDVTGNIGRLWPLVHSFFFIGNCTSWRILNRENRLHKLLEMCLVM